MANEPRPGRIRRSEQVSDAAFMEMAIEEARATIGRTSPNPPVGAVLVRDGELLARGRTAAAGGPHAEVVAMREAGRSLRGATLYTTLEPCCHHGRTGPCTAAIIGSGITRVVVGCRDKNPKVCGLGIETLEQAGIEVAVGVRGEVCEEMARPFFTWIEKERPYVVLKAAATMDGRIATHTGDSRWITGEEARERVHRWRDRFDAVLVGAGTVVADDPALTTRLREGGGRDPLRVVLDGDLVTDPGAKIYRQGSGAPTWLVTSAGREASRLERYLSAGGAIEEKARAGAEAARDGAGGVEVIVLPGEQGRVRVEDLLKELGRREIVSLLVEGGGEVHGAFLASGLVDEIRLFMAPRVLGSGPSWVSMPPGRAAERVEDAPRLGKPDVEPVGDDLLLVSRL